MTNIIESGQAARRLGAELLARDRASLDAGCEDARCGATCKACPPPARHCTRSVVLVDEAEDTQGGDAA